MQFKSEILYQGTWLFYHTTLTPHSPYTPNVECIS